MEEVGPLVRPRHPLSNMAMRMEIELVERMERSAKELAKAVAEEAGKPRWKPYVDALIRLKGVDVQTAFLACAEFGDFSRFRSGRRVSRWIGCTSSEDSSGESRRQCDPNGALARRAPFCVTRSLPAVRTGFRPNPSSRAAP